jgi:hypothetical protein
VIPCSLPSFFLPTFSSEHVMYDCTIWLYYMLPEYSFWLVVIIFLVSGDYKGSICELNITSLMLIFIWRVTLLWSFSCAMWCLVSEKLSHLELITCLNGLWIYFISMSKVEYGYHWLKEKGKDQMCWRPSIRKNSLHLWLQKTHMSRR